jgi:hypothetical protein
MSSEATASSIWEVALAPTRGAVTAGLLCGQARAIWARVTPRPAAIAPTASMIAWSLPEVSGV